MANWEDGLPGSIFQLPFSQQPDIQLSSNFRTWKYTLAQDNLLIKFQKICPLGFWDIGLKGFTHAMLFYYYLVFLKRDFYGTLARPHLPARNASCRGHWRSSPPQYQGAQIFRRVTVTVGCFWWKNLTRESTKKWTCISDTLVMVQYP